MTFLKLLRSFNLYPHNSKQKTKQGIDRVHELMFEIFEQKLFSYFAELWTRFSNSMDGALTIMDAMARLDSDLCDRSCLVGKMRLQTDFTKEEIGRMAVDLIVAAADTTSITAAWILHKLSTDEREQENINKDPRCRRKNSCKYHVWNWGNTVLKISGKFVSTKRNVSDFIPWLHFSHEFPKGPFNWPVSKFQPVI